MAEFGVQPQTTVIEVGFGWFARFLDLPSSTSNFRKKVFSHNPIGHKYNTWLNNTVLMKNGTSDEKFMSFVFDDIQYL